MLNVEITFQKAIAILRKEKIANLLRSEEGIDKNDPLINIMYQVILRDFKDGRDILLSSGAKLIKFENKYYIKGYSQDGSDVNTYLKKKEVKIK